MANLSLCCMKWWSCKVCCMCLWWEKWVEWAVCSQKSEADDENIAVGETFVSVYIKVIFSSLWRMWLLKSHMVKSVILITGIWCESILKVKEGLITHFMFIQSSCYRSSCSYWHLTSFLMQCRWWRKQNSQFFLRFITLWSLVKLPFF